MKAYLNEHLTDLKEAWCHILKNSKIIGKVARFFAIVSFGFVAFSAIITFFLIQVASPSAPSEYSVLLILSNIVPYLFIAALSLVIAFIVGNVENEISEKESLPQAQSEVVNP